MRSSFRSLLTYFVISVFLFITWFTSGRDQVRIALREHLRDLSRYRPAFQWSSSITSDTTQQHSQDTDRSAPQAYNILLPNNYSHLAPHDDLPQKAVVMARLSSEDTTWVDELLQWIPYVYTVDNPSAPLHTTCNKGRESLAYLTYIIENYDNLACTVAFVHSHRDGWPRAWHTDATDYSNVNSLNALRTDYVQEQGYVNLRCNTAVGCPGEIQPYRVGDEVKREDDIESIFLSTWPHFFPELGITPQIIATPCCAQFAVSAAQIRKRPRTDYERIRDWVLKTPLNDDVTGRVMEYTWHVAFGRDPVFCPDVGTCWCKVYGECWADAELTKR